MIKMSCIGSRFNRNSKTPKMEPYGTPQEKDRKSMELHFYRKSSVTKNTIQATNLISRVQVEGQELSSHTKKSSQHGRACFARALMGGSLRPQLNPKPPTVIVSCGIGNIKNCHQIILVLKKSLKCRDTFRTQVLESLHCCPINLLYNLTYLLGLKNFPIISLGKIQIFKPANKTLLNWQETL